MSIVSNVVYGLSMTSIAGWDKIYEGIPVYLSYYLYQPRYNIPLILVPILSLFFTLLSLPFISRNPR